MDRCQAGYEFPHDIFGLWGSQCKSCSSRLFFWPPDNRTWTLRKPLHHESKMTGSMQVQFLKSFKDRKLASLKDRLAHWVSSHPICINLFGEDFNGFGLFALVSNRVYRKVKLHSEHSNIKKVTKNKITPTLCNIPLLLASCTWRFNPPVFSHTMGSNSWRQEDAETLSFLVPVGANGRSTKNPTRIVLLFRILGNNWGTIWMCFTTVCHLMQSERYFFHIAGANIFFNHKTADIYFWLCWLQQKQIFDHKPSMVISWVCALES